MKQYIDVRKTPAAYRIELPLKHTLFISAQELLMIYNWCDENIEEQTSPRPWKRPRAVLIATKRVTSDERKGFSGRKSVEARAIFLQTFLHTAVSKVLARFLEELRYEAHQEELTEIEIFYGKNVRQNFENRRRKRMT